MALHLVRENSDFQIYAPIVMNAEVIAYKGEFESIRTLGMGQKREHLKSLAIEKNINIGSISEISPSSLPYALETDLVDGIVLDISKASLLKEYSFVPLSDMPYISFSLVLRKDIINTQEFSQFISYYNEAVDLLNNEDYLKDILDIDSLNNLDIKFLNLE